MSKNKSKEENNMSKELESLLSDEIKENKKKEKTRSSEILAIFAAHDYYANGLTPIELRTTLEDLGPTYVKIGQIMSSRVDLLPESFCEELQKLRSSVKPLDAEVVRALIEQETGKSIEDLFEEFEDKPLGSASIGQAHYGVLKDGTKVVMKVQRPLIEDMMIKDFELLKKLGGVANVIIDDDSSSIDLVTILEELEQVTYEELDFRIEAKNTKFFKENCIDDEEKISCPTVIDELTTKRLFTMTYVDGVSVSHKEELIEQGCDLEEIGRTIMNNYVHQVMDVGTFHGDPHQGNIMVSNGKPYWIDFGMMGHIDNKDMDFIETMISALLKSDAEALVNGISTLGATSSDTDREKLISDAEELMSKYGNIQSLDDVDISTLFDDVLDLAQNNHIELPGRFTMLVRSIITIEGVIEELCPQLNLLEILSKKLTERLKNSFDVKSTLLEWGKGLLEVGDKTVRLPALVADSLSLLNKNKLKVNIGVTGLDEPLTNIREYVNYIILAIFACVLFIGSCILCLTDFAPLIADGVPLFGVAGILFSIALAVFAVKKMWKR